MRFNVIFGSAFLAVIASLDFVFLYYIRELLINVPPVLVPAIILAAIFVNLAFGFMGVSTIRDGY